MKNQWIGILIVGLTLGTAWAIRGQFGHEQGAALAGGISLAYGVFSSEWPEESPSPESWENIACTDCH